MALDELPGFRRALEVEREQWRRTWPGGLDEKSIGHQPLQAVGDLRQLAMDAFLEQAPVCDALEAVENIRVAQKVAEDARRLLREVLVWLPRHVVHSVRFADCKRRTRLRRSASDGVRRVSTWEGGSRTTRPAPDESCYTWRGSMLYFFTRRPKARRSFRASRAARVMLPPCRRSNCKM